MTPDWLPDRRALVQHLFADVTSALEIALAFAVTGQSSKLSPEEYARCAKRLQAETEGVTTLAAAVCAVLSLATADSDDS